MRSIPMFIASVGLCLSTIASAENAKTEPKPMTKNASTTSCPEFLNHEYRKLHSKDTVNLCEKFHNKPMVLVNTASHCGYTKQFGSLEKLYQKYKAEGVEVVGFASDDFNQEAKDEEKAAGVCFKNYGVTFTMIAPSSVKGTAANPTFAYLGSQSAEPNWNFNKYLVSADGKSITHFGSKTQPVDSELETALASQLK